MSLEQKLTRHRLAAMLIVAGLGLGLTAEPLPHDVAGAPEVDGGAAQGTPHAAILRYILSNNPEVAASRVRDYPAALLTASRAHGIDHCLALAQAQVESLFSPDAVGRAGEIGLYQVLPSTAAAFGRSAEELFDPHVNTSVALAYLSDILSRKPALRDALAEYNGGPRNRSPYYALNVLETYTRVLRHGDLDCAPEHNPAFATASHVLPAPTVRRASYQPAR
jgi:hypothetical protein